MTTHSKTVILKDTNITSSGKFTETSPIVPRKGINIAWKLIDKKNGECYATFYGSDRPNSKDEIIYTKDINDELSNLNKRLLSDRARTIKNKPQFNVINGRKEKIR